MSLLNIEFYGIKKIWDTAGQEKYHSLARIFKNFKNYDKKLFFYIKIIFIALYYKGRFFYLFCKKN